VNNYIQFNSSNKNVYHRCGSVICSHRFEPNVLLWCCVVVVVVFFICFVFPCVIIWKYFVFINSKIKNVNEIKFDRAHRIGNKYSNTTRLRMVTFNRRYPELGNLGFPKLICRYKLTFTVIASLSIRYIRLVNLLRLFIKL
jgi:hypothetical protein